MDVCNVTLHPSLKRLCHDYMKSLDAQLQLVCNLLKLRSVMKRLFSGSYKYCHTGVILLDACVRVAVPPEQLHL